ncbi:hypothetical protein GTO27_12925 [Candidatus Bathyarchaeota archaeon]|nr:hypothetical protein [Candidatus Bathyarchaeota archaeon]
MTSHEWSDPNEILKELNSVTDPSSIIHFVAKAKKARGAEFLVCNFHNLTRRVKLVLLQSLSESEVRENQSALLKILCREQGIFREELLRSLMKCSASEIEKELYKHYKECSVDTKIMIVEYLSESPSKESIETLKRISSFELEPEPKRLLTKAIKKATAIRCRIKVLLMCALYEEGDALKTVLNDVAELNQQTGEAGVVTILNEKEGNVVAFLTVVGRSGNVASGETLERLIKIYSPNMLIVFGIAAGIPGRIGIGDVMIANEVWDLRKCKIGDEFGFMPRSIKSPEGVALPFQIERLQQMLNTRLEKNITIFTDLICGSSDNLVRKTAYVKAAAQTNQKLGGIEMEAVGIATVCVAHKLPFFVVKAISDYGDEKKDDSSHAFCCRAAAAAVVYGFLLPHKLGN